MKIERSKAYDLAPILSDQISQSVSDASDHEYVAINLGYGEQRHDIQGLSDAYHQLRFRIYNEYGYINDNQAINIDNNMEYDVDDERSTHFVVLKQRKDIGRTALISCMRVIQKDNRQPLPIEDCFPELFPEPISVGSVEASRLISVDLEVSSRLRILQNLSVLGRNNILNRPLGVDGEAYAMVAEDVRGALNYVGITSEKLAEPKFAGYHVEDVPIRLGVLDIDRGYGGAERLSRICMQPNRTIWSWGSGDRQSFGEVQL